MMLNFWLNSGLRVRRRRWRRFHQRNVDQPLNFTSGPDHIDVKPLQQHNGEDGLHGRDRGERKCALARSRHSPAICVGGHERARLRLAVVAAAWRCRGAVDRSAGKSAADCTSRRPENSAADDAMADEPARNAAGDEAGRSA